MATPMRMATVAAKVMGSVAAVAKRSEAMSLLKVSEATAPMVTPRIVVSVWSPLLDPMTILIQAN
jgi:hypothetical protein